jgi:hypothetical protein
MDVKVDVSNVLPGDHPAADNAGIWLRQHLQIEPQYTIFEEFEEYFNCRIDVADRKDTWMQPNKFVFETGADVTAFVLKWS